jgi:hypothetical protein
MTVEEIDKLSASEARGLLKTIYNSPYINIYFSLKNQMDKLSKEIEASDIDFKQDGASFKNFIAWGKDALTITNNLEQILSKIDVSALKEQEQIRTRAEVGTVESYVRK